MKTTSRKNILLGTALLGFSTTFGIASPSVAAPQNRDDRRDDSHETREDRRDVKRSRKHGRHTDRQGENRDARRGFDDDREGGRDERREPRRGDGRGRGGRGRGGRGRGDAGGRFEDRGRGDNRPSYDPNFGDHRDTNGGQSFIGTVTRVRSNESFDINVNGSVYNVYLNAPTSRALSVGDTVRVNGVRQDKNDIRNASVFRIRNR